MEMISYESKCCVLDGGLSGEMVAEWKGHRGKL